jgi:primase-polymerase (primpol)-like protein
MGPPQRPRVRALISENIPDILKQLDRWVVWRAGPLKESGKFDKIPVDPMTDRPVSALDPRNWLSFQPALEAYSRGIGSGIGIALSGDHPMLVNGEPFFLTALDFDQCGDRLASLKALWTQLGKPYVEESPSGNGLRMFGLSRQLLRGGNAGEGREMYASARFVTVTGSGARGTV